MPFVRVEGWAHTHPPEKDGRGIHNGIQLLGKALQEAFVAAQVPGIESVKQVKIRKGPPQLFDDDRVLSIHVEGLFDRADRTKEVRDRLVDSLARAAAPFFPKGWKIWVLDHPFSEENSWKAHEVK